MPGPALFVSYLSILSFSALILNFLLRQAALGPRSSVNDNFYGMATTPRSIAEGGVTMPVGKPTLINEVYEKLNKLSAGQTYEPSPDEAARVASLRVSAQLASEEANRAADVVHVNAEAEAAKE